MAIVTNKRSVMTLYTGASDLYSHQSRIVLAEKGVSVDYVLVDPNNIPEDLAEINPYASMPTLVDRDLVLFSSRIIMEYLDERFPHPPLLPIYPVARARARLMMYRLEKEWYAYAQIILENKDEKLVEQAQNDLRNSLVSVAKMFSDSTFFLSDEFSLIDCVISPLLWRLNKLGVKLPAGKSKPILDYMDKVFARESFQASLTEKERDSQ